MYTVKIIKTISFPQMFSKCGSNDPDDGKGEKRVEGDSLIWKSLFKHFLWFRSVMYTVDMKVNNESLVSCT